MKIDMELRPCTTKEFVDATKAYTDTIIDAIIALRGSRLPINVAVAACVSAAANLIAQTPEPERTKVLGDLQNCVDQVIRTYAAAPKGVRLS